MIQFAIGDAATKGGVHRFRVEFQHLVVIRDGFFVVLAGGVHIGALHPGVLVGRVERDGLGVIRDGEVPLLFLRLQVTAVEKRLGVIRLQFDGLFEIGQRAFRIVLAGMGIGAAEKGPCVARREADGLVEIVQCQDIAAGMAIGDAPVDQRFGNAGIAGQRAAQIVEREFVFFLPDIGDAPAGIAARDGIARQPPGIEQPAAGVDDAVRIGGAVAALRHLRFDFIGPRGDRDQ